MQPQVLLGDAMKQSEELNSQPQLQDYDRIQESEIQKTYRNNFEKQELEPTKDASEHGFRVYKVDQNIKQISLKIMSSQQILYKFTDFISDYRDVRDTNVLNMSLLNNVINVIKDLIGFIFGCEYSKIVTSGSIFMFYFQIVRIR